MKKITKNTYFNKNLNKTKFKIKYFLDYSPLDEWLHIYLIGGCETMVGGRLGNNQCS